MIRMLLTACCECFCQVTGIGSVLRCLCLEIPSKPAEGTWCSSGQSSWSGSPAPTGAPAETAPNTRRRCEPPRTAVGDRRRVPISSRLSRIVARPADDVRADYRWQLVRRRLTGNHGRARDATEAERLGWDGAENGAPMLDPRRPYGREDLLTQLQEVFGTGAAEEMARRHVEMYFVLARALKHGALVPGRYPLGNIAGLRCARALRGYDGLSDDDLGVDADGYVSLTDEHLTLLRGIEIRWPSQYDCDDRLGAGEYPGGRGRCQAALRRLHPQRGRHGTAARRASGGTDRCNPPVAALPARRRNRRTFDPSPGLAPAPSATAPGRCWWPCRCSWNRWNWHPQRTALYPDHP